MLRGLLCHCNARFTAVILVLGLCLKGFTVRTKIPARTKKVSTTVQYPFEIGNQIPWKRKLFSPENKAPYMCPPRQKSPSVMDVEQIEGQGLFSKFYISLQGKFLEGRGGGT